MMMKQATVMVKITATAYAKKIGESWYSFVTIYDDKILKLKLIKMISWNQNWDIPDSMHNKAR